MKDIESEVEIGAEPPRFDELAQVAIGGRDHARSHRPRLRRADPLELAIFQNAQQLDLQRRTELADLVEKDRAVARHLEAARMMLDRTGEGALLVSEQLALDDGFGERAAVHVDEATVRSVREMVDGPGEHSLAGAGLTAQQNCRAHGRHGTKFIE